MLKEINHYLYINKVNKHMKQYKIFTLLYISLNLFCSPAAHGPVPDKSQKNKNSYQTANDENFVSSRQYQSVGRETVNTENDTVYFFLIDRFYDADPTNNYNYQPANPFGWHGGDIAGAIEKLDHIKNMGFTTIWISPPVDNQAAPTSKFYHFYHGYHAVDFYSIDEHFGDIELYKKFVNEAHMRGLKVLQDLVLNHTAPLHPFYTDHSGKRNEHYRDWFHNGKGGPQETEDEIKKLYDAPDFNHLNPHVQQFLIDNAIYWANEAGVNGFRLDAVKHISYDFWPIFTDELKRRGAGNLFLLGEVLSRDQNAYNRYTDAGINSVFDFLTHYAIFDVFKDDQSMHIFTEVFKRDEVYRNPQKLATFVDNHDTERFATGLDPVIARKKLKSALTLIYTIRGMPVVYSGTEALITSKKGEDPATGRKIPPWGLIKRGQFDDILKHLDTLNNLRKETDAFSNANMKEIYRDYSVYVYARSGKKYSAFVIINNLPQAQVYEFDLLKQTGLQAQRIKEVLSGMSYPVNSGKLRFRLSPYQSYVFISREPVNIGKGFQSVASTDRLPVHVKKHQFEYKSKTARRVAVTGNFSGWYKIDMQQKQPGIWQLSLPLKEGIHQYKFVVDGDYISDPQNSNNSGEPYNNSLLEIEL